MLLKTTSVIRITYCLSGANLYCVCRLAQFIYFIDPSFTRHIQFVLFLIFVFSCKTAPYMTFTLIFFKQFLDLLIELWRELWKSVSQIFMYCGLADSKLPCSRSDGCFVAKHIFAKHDRAFFLGLNHFYDHPFQYIWCN